MRNSKMFGLLLAVSLLSGSYALEARQPPSGTRPVIPKAECVKRILDGNFDKMAYEIMGINHLGTLYGAIAQALDKRGAHYAGDGADFFVSTYIELNSDRWTIAAKPDDGRIYKLAVLELKFICLSHGGPEGLALIDAKSVLGTMVQVEFKINTWGFAKDDLDTIIQNFLPLIDKALPKK